MREKEREIERVREREKVETSEKECERLSESGKVKRGSDRGKTERENWKNTNLRHWKHEKWKE